LRQDPTFTKFQLGVSLFRGREATKLRFFWVIGIFALRCARPMRNMKK
jgi:hypothetical protein